MMQGIPQTQQVPQCGPEVRPQMILKKQFCFVFHPKFKDPQILPRLLLTP